MEAGTRKTVLDGIRVLASFGVIYNHVFVYAFFDAPGPFGVAAQFAFFLSKMAVPLFLMTSGMLLLTRTDPYKKNLRRVLRFAIVLAGMGIFYYCVRCVRMREPFSAGVLLRTLMSYGPPDTNAFWYLYMYLGVLLMLPLLQQLAERMQEKDFRYLFLVSAVFTTLLPLAQHFLHLPPYNENLRLPLFSAYLAALFFGLYTGRYLPADRRGLMYAALGVIAFTSVSVLLTRLDPNAFSDDGYLYYDDRTLLPILAAAGCAFYGCKCLEATTVFSERVRSLLKRLGGLAFGAYLFGDFFGIVLSPLEAAVTVNRSSYGGLLLYTCMIYACAMLLSAVLHCVPGLKRLL